MVTTKWLAALSSGDTVVEGEPPYNYTPGDVYSPWWRLVHYLRDNDLHITGMRIQCRKGNEPARTYNLPSHNVLPSGQHPKWNYIRPIVPVGYGYRRATRRSLTTQEERRYIEVYAGFEDGLLLSLLVDEIEGTESWTVLHKPEKMPVLA